MLIIGCISFLVAFLCVDTLNFLIIGGFNNNIFIIVGFVVYREFEFRW